MSGSLFDLELVEAATRLTLAEGRHRVLQTHRYGPDERSHVDLLLSLFQPLPRNPVIVDAGCGFGEVSRLMARRMLDACFILVNLSPAQLAECPVAPWYRRLLADCHALPLEAASVDAVMFSSALTQMDTPVALAEAARVTRPGGVLLVNEMVHFGAGNDLLEHTIRARVPLLTDLLRDVEQAGFHSMTVNFPESSDQHLRDLLREAGIEHGLNDVRACVIRAVRAA